jgi:hypothetical protein
LASSNFVLQYKVKVTNAFIDIKELTVLPEQGHISAISWRPIYVVEEARVFGENHQPWASNW